MQFTQSMSYPGTVDEVVAMYLTPDYLERRFGRFVVEGSTTVSVEGERVSYAGTVRPELIPAAATRFVKSDLRVTFTEEWTLNEAEATSRTSVTVDGAPEGYEGNIGLVTKYIADLPLADPAKAKAVVVGPPPMMKFTIIELLKKGFKEENITVSYERKMCCGLGKCGHCRVSDTYICLDGPVFNYVEAKEMID